ncbi:hypothetical protein [Streptomyces sp. ISL-100]|uniref:hypothetical protein n=1 Tax=Streptomyces sp. ISL-100 TaxID=2819173 RepID=UPI001BE9FFED|nr:hypothetical protein [Streptomyces sp. ISL-100]MBT2401574.1 hypothetical protein [Streptomyces sp. ISL-100]
MTLSADEPHGVHTRALAVRALAAQSRLLLESVREERIAAPEDLSDVLLPMAADLRQSLHDIGRLCEALLEASPESVHGADLRRCADGLKGAAGRLTSVMMNDMCLGGV